MRRLFGSAVCAAAAVATAAACSFSAGSGLAVDKDELAKEISAQLEQVGHALQSVECPRNLKGEVGAQVRCEVTDDSEKYGVNVTVTKVEGTDVEFDITAFLDKDVVAERISRQLEHQVGRRPESVTCPDDLEGKVGDKLRCELADGGSTYGVNVTVTKVDGSDIEFNIKVDDQAS